jgi:primosomal protein N' (replication factor Y)
MVRQHDYKLFFNTEIQLRQQFAYPPFSRIIHILCKHKFQNTTQLAIQFLHQRLYMKYGQYLIGPAEPPISRIRNQYIWELMLKLPRNNAFIFQCKQFILKSIIDMHHEKNLSQVHVVVDVDAM